mmetsp:Transcript_25688/g.80414  ORF Transcript_25688/g.80414 Transcript_25688/m.80414 type:complete len:120 (-) Transcript_25688:287-646(-)
MGPKRPDRYVYIPSVFVDRVAGETLVAYVAQFEDDADEGGASGPRILIVDEFSRISFWTEFNIAAVGACTIILSFVVLRCYVFNNWVHHLMGRLTLGPSPTAAGSRASRRRRASSPRRR